MWALTTSGGRTGGQEAGRQSEPNQPKTHPHNHPLAGSLAHSLTRPLSHLSMLAKTIVEVFYDLSLPSANSCSVFTSADVLSSKPEEVYIASEENVLLGASMDLYVYVCVCVCVCVRVRLCVTVSERASEPLSDRGTARQME